MAVNITSGIMSNVLCALGAEEKTRQSGYTVNVGNAKVTRTKLPDGAEYIIKDSKDKETACSITKNRPLFKDKSIYVLSTPVKDYGWLKVIGHFDCHVKKTDAGYVADKPTITIYNPEYPRSNTREIEKNNEKREEIYLMLQTILRAENDADYKLIIKAVIKAMP